MFASYHANKRGVTLDVARDDAVSVLETLGAAADIVVAHRRGGLPSRGSTATADGCTGLRPNASWSL